MLPFNKPKLIFGEAVTLARQLGDREAEYGYQGNLGILYNLKGDFDEAIEVFAKILENMRETVNQELELQVVHRIIGIYSKTGDNQKTIDHCLQGLELARYLADTSIFYFYETLIASLYRLGNIEESHQYYQQAIDTAIRMGSQR